MVSSNTSSPLVWLVAGQFLLYALGWLVCSVPLRRERSAVVHWALFMLLMGSGFLLVAARDGTRGWWPYVGSNLAFAAGYLALWRGLNHFFGVASHDLERLLIMLGLGGLLVVLGPGDAAAPLRVALAFGLGSWAVMRMMMTNRAALRAEFGGRVHSVVLWLASLVALLLAWRSAQQLLQTHQALEIHRSTDANLRLIFSFMAAAALFNFAFIGLLIARLVARLHLQALHDPLTGLFNRRACDDALARSWQRWRRGGGGFAVLMLDLDHFKRVNDQHGHAAGDAVLEAVARRLSDLARADEVLARVGGEEFMLLMPLADADAAGRAAERLRAAVAGQAIVAGDLSLVQTVSVGVAIVQDGDEALHSVLRRADAALYRAKATGRNRVEPASVTA